jgi:hypothetical protein
LFGFAVRNLDNPDNFKYINVMLMEKWWPGSFVRQNGIRRSPEGILFNIFGKDIEAFFR